MPHLVHLNGRGVACCWPGACRSGCRCGQPAVCHARIRAWCSPACLCGRQHGSSQLLTAEPRRRQLAGDHLPRRRRRHELALVLTSLAEGPPRGIATQRLQRHCHISSGRLNHAGSVAALCHRAAFQRQHFRRHHQAERPLAHAGAIQRCHGLAQPSGSGKPAGRQGQCLLRATQKGRWQRRLIVRERGPQ